MAVAREAPRALDAHALLDVAQDLLVARLVADDEQPEPVVLQDAERVAIDVRARVGRPGDAELAEPARDLHGAPGVGGEGVVVEEQLLHLGEAPLQLRALLEDVPDAARAVAVAGRHLRPEAEGAARRAAAAGVERHVRVLAVRAVVLLVVEVARVDVGGERQRVELLGGERRRLVVLHVGAVAEEADAVDVLERPSLGDRDHRQVELLARDVVDHAGVAQRLLGSRRHVAADEADHGVRLGVLQRLRGADVGAERRRAGVDDDVVVVAGDLHHVLDGQVLGRRVEQPRARQHAGRVREPGRVPERPDLALRLVARAGSPVEVVVRRRIQEQRAHPRFSSPL